MSTYSDLRQDSFQGLETLATAFEGLVRNWKFSSELTGDVITPLQGSNWNGDAAESAATAVTKARNELDAAFEEASAIAKALREAHSELAAARADLDAALKKAADHSLTVDADGANVSWPAPTSEADKHDPSYEQTYRRLAQEVGVDISKAVARAEAADAAAATALGGATGTDRTAFRPSSGPEEQGKQAADLLKLAGNISDAQLDQLNKLLKDHANDPQFTTAFYNRLGPDGFLKYYGSMATLSSGKDGRRPQAIADLQKNLGLALATATDTHNLPHLSDEWEAGLRRAGATRVEVLPGGSNRASGSVQPYGYQILSNILQAGKYDPHFLNPVAEHVTQLAEMPGFFTSTPWIGSDLDQMKLLRGPDGGFNPMVGVLDALGRNPEAATKFFHDLKTEYNLDGSVKSYSQANDYLAKLTAGGDQSPLQDILQGNGFIPSGHAEAPGVHALGLALEAATTGRASDASPDAPLPQHTPEMAKVMHDVVDRFGNGDGPKLLRKGADFADLAPSLGNLTAAYMGDVQSSLDLYDKTLPTYGAPAKLDHDNTAKLLGALGRNPEAYGAIAQAQQAYTTAHIQDVILHRDSHGAQFDTAVFNAAHPGGEVAGILTSARTDALVNEMKDDAKAYNDSIDRNVKWGRKVWDMTGGKLLAPVPGAVPVVNYLIDHATSSYYIKDVNTADAAVSSYDSGVSAVQSSVKEAVEQASQGTGLTQTQIEDLSTGAVHAAEAGESHSRGLFTMAING
ncbi:hypothetical protein [Kitasatospora aureofaciens]|uniref:hypothetical protein n=1 Tax=Kitasatospora aureofaciens TaxID=1894 RepID=UPI0037CADF07